MDSALSCHYPAMWGQASSLPPAFQPAFLDPGETPGKSPAAG